MIEIRLYSALKFFCGVMEIICIPTFQFPWRDFGNTFFPRRTHCPLLHHIGIVITYLKIKLELFSFKIYFISLQRDLSTKTFLYNHFTRDFL